MDIEKFRDITLGTSYSPELIKATKKERLQVLRYIVEDLKIKDLRLGLRWNRVEKESQKLSLDFYRPYIDYCIKEKVNICLNIGPIKTFRWPETHIPNHILLKRNINEGQNIGQINLDDELSKYALEYLENLLGLLKKDYGGDLSDMTFQLENEAFYPFGSHKITLGEDHVLKTVEIIKKISPKNKLMFSSAGRTNLKQLFGLFSKIQGLYSNANLTLGFNFYYKTPTVTNIPFLTAMNPIYFAPPWEASIEDLKKEAQNKNFQVEISEAQFEPWMEQTDPGNKYDDFVYLLKTSLMIFPSDQTQKIVRLWGSESFALKFLKNKENNEHVRIKDLILQMGNNQA
jgi:hypothetical protein